MRGCFIVDATQQELFNQYSFLYPSLDYKQLLIGMAAIMTTGRHQGNKSYKQPLPSYHDHDNYLTLQRLPLLGTTTTDRRPLGGLQYTASTATAKDTWTE